MHMKYYTFSSCKKFKKKGGNRINERVSNGKEKNEKAKKEPPHVHKNCKNKMEENKTRENEGE